LPLVKEGQTDLWSINAIPLKIKHVAPKTVHSLMMHKYLGYNPKKGPRLLKPDVMIQTLNVLGTAAQKTRCPPLRPENIQMEAIYSKYACFRPI
jgi:hypothetical protein